MVGKLIKPLVTSVLVMYLFVFLLGQLREQLSYLKGDNFFRFTCSDCSEDGKEQYDFHCEIKRPSKQLNIVKKLCFN